MATQIRESRILGPDGQPIRLQELTREIAAPTLAGVRNAWHGGIAGNLTPERLASIIQAANDGEGHDYLTLAEEMEERDLHYGAVLGTRKRAISGLDVTAESPSDDAKHVAITDDVRNLVGMPEFGELIDDLVDALGKSYSVAEIMWRRGKKWAPVEYIHRDPRFFTVDRIDGRTLRLIDEQNINGIPLAPYKFIVHQPRIKTGLTLRGGLARFVAVAYMCKSYTLTDWMAFAELFGMPIRVGRYGENAGEDNINILRTAVANIGSDAAAVMPKSMEIEFVEAAKSQGGDKLFAVLAEYLDKQVSKGVLGQTMTTDDGASLSQAKVHDDVRIDILKADTKALENTLNRQLVKPYVDLNYGVQEVYPRVCIPVPEPEDLKLWSDAIVPFVDRGLRVEQSVVRDKFGVPDPDKDAEILTSKSTSPAPESAARNNAHDCGCPIHGTALNRAGVDGDDLIDELTEDALADWEPLMEPVMEPIMKAVNAATSFDDLKSRLDDLLPDMDTSAIVQHLATQMMKARGLGDTNDAV